MGLSFINKSARFFELQPIICRDLLYAHVFKIQSIMYCDLSIKLHVFKLQSIICCGISIKCAHLFKIKTIIWCDILINLPISSNYNPSYVVTYQ